MTPKAAGTAAASSSSTLHQKRRRRSTVNTAWAEDVEQVVQRVQGESHKAKRHHQGAVSIDIYVQKRKGRCSGGEPCQFCSKANRVCEYGDRPSRTPLTRRNLDRAEAQCQALAKALKAAKPGVDVEEIIRGVSSIVDTSDRPPNDGCDGGDRQQGASPPPLPTHEHYTRKEADGMALLSAGASRIGFLGNFPYIAFTCHQGELTGKGESSASGLLASIERILMDSPNDADDEARRLEASRSLRHGLEQSSKRVTAQACRGYVDSYFRYFGSAYPLIDEQGFRNRHGPDFTARSQGISDIVRLMVLAMGAFKGSTSCEKDDLVFYVEARSSLTLRDTESASIPLIQALALMGNYQQKRDRPNTGYMFVGMACRAAVAIGLHRQAEDDSRHPLDKYTEQMRRRVFWCLFNIESGFSFTVGRPPAIDLRYITVPFPAETSDTSSAAHVSDPRAAPQSPTSCSVLVYHARLALISNRLHSVALSARADVTTAMSSMQTFERELEEWNLSLPPSFFHTDHEPGFIVARSLLFWREQNIRMTMYKAVLSLEQNQSPTQDLETAKYLAQSKCLELSCDTINSISDYAEAGDGCVRGVTWYCMYFLIHAVLYMDLAWLQGARLLDQHDFDRIRTRAERTLLKFRETNPSADRFVKFLWRIRQHYLQLEDAQQLENDKAQRQNDTSTLPSASLAMYGTEVEGLAFDQNIWIDPSFNFLLEDPLVAPLFDDMSFYPT